MFCNTCILFVELSFLGLGSELETKQASHPLASFAMNEKNQQLLWDLYAGIARDAKKNQRLLWKLYIK
jgi:hypothetical protein